jgi:hypothetical protein
VAYGYHTPPESGPFDDPSVEGDRAMADDGDGDRLVTMILIGLVVAILLMVGALVITARYVQKESGAAPDTEWELTRLNASHGRIAHVGSKPVAASSLSVTVDGVPVHPAWPEGTVTEGNWS